MLKSFAKPVFLAFFLKTANKIQSFFNKTQIKFDKWPLFSLNGHFLFIKRYCGSAENPGSE